jgi:PAS domain S-box-containing protein
LAHSIPAKSFNATVFLRGEAALSAQPDLVSTEPKNVFAFLNGGGEMGLRMRELNWEKTPVGAPEKWPQALRTAVRLLLTTNHPMCIFWGLEHTFFYNDSYSASLGHEQHPSILGTPGRQAWADIWDIIFPQISLVMNEGGATWHVDQPVPMLRNGRTEYVNWTYSYGPIDDEAAPCGVGGVMVITNETTAHVTAIRQSAFRAELEHALENVDDSEDVIAVGSALLGKYLGANSVGYSELDETGENLLPHKDWVAEGFTGLSGVYRLNDYGPSMLIELRAGRTVVIEDVWTHPFTKDAAETGAYEALDIGAFACAPLLQRGKLIGLFYALSAPPRAWTENDITVLEDVAQRTWASVERARYVAALKKSEARFQAIADSIDDMIWSADVSGHHDYYNNRWYDFTGTKRGDLQQTEWYEMCHPDDRAIAKDAWQYSLVDGAPLNYEFRLRHYSGGHRWVLCRATATRDEKGRITKWYGTCTDIQDLVDARDVLSRSRNDLEKLVQEKTAELMISEHQLRQSQKMEAIGQLTGGIAHDFNNMLAVVLGSLSLLKRALAAENKLDEKNLTESRTVRHVDAAVDGAKRAAALTKRLLAFSRQQALKSELINANSLIEGMSDILRLTLGDEYTIETVLGPDLWLIDADVSQLENVILNLAVNARDAMLDTKRLKIETSNCVLDDIYISTHHGVAAGDYVMIAVTDEGVGMEPEVLAKMFEPFFTTKPVGKGTGLGLSQVYGFVKQSGGDVNIRSKPGIGTIVTVYLPRAHIADSGVVKNAVSVAESSSAATAPAADLVPDEAVESVLMLVVEDDASVRQFVVDSAEILGHRTLQTDNGADALKLIDAHPGIQLLLSDIVMPDMNGRKLAEGAARRRPDLKILLMTGYAKQSLLSSGEADLTAHLIWKPFTIEQLDEKLKEVLGLRGHTVTNRNI